MFQKKNIRTLRRNSMTPGGFQERNISGGRTREEAGAPRRRPRPRTDLPAGLYPRIMNAMMSA